MANPLLEGITLVNAARGLLHELKGIPAALRGNDQNKVSSNDFAAALKQAYAAGAAQAKPASGPLPPAHKAAASIAQVQEKLAQFAAEIGNLFKQESVDTEVSDVVLQMDSTGKVVVANDHPQKAMIESLFQLFPGLTLSFRQLSLNAAAFQSSQQNTLYHQSYLLNPASVPEGLTTINPAGFEVVIGPDRLDWGFGESSSGADDTEGTDSTTA